MIRVAKKPMSTPEAPNYNLPQRIFPYDCLSMYITVKIFFISFSTWHISLRFEFHNLSEAAAMLSSSVGFDEGVA